VFYWSALRTSAVNRAGHTRTSLLRFASVTTAETNGWMLPESQAFMQEQLDKSVEAYQGLSLCVVGGGPTGKYCS